jgi:hypothetical protein
VNPESDSGEAHSSPESGKRALSLIRRHGVTLLFLVVALLTFRQYGATWDEPVQSRYGELALRYFATAGGDQRADTFLNLKWYGPFFEMVPAAVYRYAPSHKYEIRHLFIALTAVGAVAGAGAYAALLGIEPLFGQLALLFIPQFYGHSFNNSKDIPFACAIVWTMVAMARLIEAPTRRRILLAGLALGCALSIRVGALMFVGIIFVTIVLLRKRTVLVPFALSFALAWVIMVATWPSAHRHPFAHPAAAFRESATFALTYKTLFEGHPVLSDQLPRRYLAEMLALTTPIPLALCAVAGLVMLLRRRNEASVLLTLWFAVPFGLFILARPNVYDGIRHFLFLLPAIALFAAVAISRVRWLLLPVAIVSVLAIVRLFPYEMTYYNAFAGGTRGAQNRFETDYWVASYREAALWLRAHPTGPKTRVLVAATYFSSECLGAYLPKEQFEVARTLELGLKGPLPPAIDYYVGTTRFAFDRNFAGSPVVHAIGRDGATFTVIRKR